MSVLGLSELCEGVASLEGVLQKQVGEVQHLQDIFAVLATCRSSSKSLKPSKIQVEIYRDRSETMF